MLIEATEENRAPDLVERELTEGDYVAINRALDTKRGLGWVHAVGLAREREEFQEEVRRLRAELRGQAGRPRESEG